MRLLAKMFMFVWILPPLLLLCCGEERRTDPPVEVADPLEDKAPITGTARSGKLVFASLEWEPYVGPNLEKGGYVVELVTQAYMAAGYAREDIEFQFLPWARALKMSEAGVFDGLVPEYYMAERKSLFTYSAPFPGGPVGFYKEKSRNLTYTDFDDLGQQFIDKGWKIGVVRDYLNTAEFDRNEKIAKVKEFANSDRLNLQKLSKGRIQLVFVDKFTARSIIRQNPNSDELAAKLEFMEPPLEYKDLYIAFSKKGKQLQKAKADFDRGLGILKENGKLDTIKAKHELK